MGRVRHLILIWKFLFKQSEAGPKLYFQVLSFLNETRPFQPFRSLCYTKYQIFFAILQNCFIIFFTLVTLHPLYLIFPLLAEQLMLASVIAFSHSKMQFDSTAVVQYHQKWSRLKSKKAHVLGKPVTCSQIQGISQCKRTNLKS